MGYTLELTAEAKYFIADKGYDVQFGARPLKRAIQQYVEDTLADIVLGNTMHEGDVIVMDLDKENMKITGSIKEKTVNPALES
jgi:ATP-dependent Clp protease ATP-binding subunit ClpC